MRFMTIVKSVEKNGQPPQALMEAIGKLGQEEAKAGTLIETGGLYPTTIGARVFDCPAASCRSSTVRSLKPRKSSAGTPCSS